MSTQASSLTNSSPCAPLSGFWQLQEWLQAVEKLFEKPENWKLFHAPRRGTCSNAVEEKLSKLLGLFARLGRGRALSTARKYPVSASQREPAQGPESQVPRQVPRARAFRVQLDDAHFRQQFLVQVLIALQALEHDVSTKPRPGGLIATQPKDVQDAFHQLRAELERGLEQTRPGAKQMLAHLLAREVHWVNWKGQGCREWEYDSQEMLTGKVPEQDSLPETFKVSIPPVPKAELDQITKQLLKQAVKSARNLPIDLFVCFFHILF